MVEQLGAVAPAGLSRREVLAGIGGAAVAVALAGYARAATPKPLAVGTFKVTTFSDGHLNLPSSMFAPKADAGAREAAFKAAGQGHGQDGGTIRSPLNVTLVDTGKEKILVDVGSGSRFMDTAGKLTETLEEAGVEPESITHVIYTHAHPDHVWGTVNDFDELSFPNAKYFISEDEWNFWMAKDVLSKLPKERHGFAVGAQRNLKAAKDQLATIKPGRELVGGVNVIDTSGHTPGHVSLEIGKGKDTVVVLGDALTHPVISFQHPDWQPATDQIPDRAVATRMRLLDKLAADGSRLIGYHLPEPGMGRVVRKGSGFAFAPLA